MRVWMDEPRRLGPGWAASSPLRQSLNRLRAIVLLLACGLALAACQTTQRPRNAPPPPRAVPQQALPQRSDSPGFYRLPGTPAGTTPVRVALLLPFSSPSADTRAVASAMQRAVELALFDAGKADIILMPRDEGASPTTAAQATNAAIEDGAEIILGPLFAQSAAAVGAIAEKEGVPVIAFSTDRSVGGNGVYLLSFQPENEVQRVVNYAATHGHSRFTALVPQSAYGQLVAESFRDTLERWRNTSNNVETFADRADAVAEPVQRAAQGDPDAVLIASGGAVLRAVASGLSAAGADNRKVQYLGTGLWDDASLQRETWLETGWFAGPSPGGWADFAARYRTQYGATPPRIASLGYDAMSLVALLANGQPYRRYTRAALTDPNGFTGIDGIFRFRDDGAAERGLAVLQVTRGGIVVIDPAPTTFQQAGF